MPAPKPIIMGDIDSRSGALVITRNLAEVTQVNVEMTKGRLRRMGYEITPAVEAQLEQLRSEDEARLHAELRARGVPEKIRQLLATDKKSELERKVSGLTSPRRPCREDSEPTRSLRGFRGQR